MKVGFMFVEVRCLKPRDGIIPSKYNFTSFNNGVNSNK